ncbi:MAG: MBOAT family O-acyltransferase [Erysipelotrichaceae bacterium]|nr:MBOAT family O-acyltransferase [Erysipelotrichaceae bacterium]
MSVLSIPYLLLSGASSIFIWLFSSHSKKITIFLANLVFLYLLGFRTADAIYVLILTVWTWFFGLYVKKKPVLVCSILIPVLGLCFYKYSNPFTGLWLAMPLGISFYTFKAISYLADRYQKKSRTASLLEVFDYLCFFPVFMAGPINRSEPFFEELNKPMAFQYRDQKNGCVLAGLGLFQKLVISSELSRQVGFYLNNPDHPELSGWYTLIGVIFYAFYIYADFDSYSNIAIGTARMMGFHLERNFFTPYLSSDIREFWRRWHISLSSWLRDYIYIPLGGNRKGKARKYLNTLIVFAVSGLWHGNTKMFLIWGLGHGILTILEDRMLPKQQKYPFLLRVLLVLVNFMLVSLLWVFFRSGSGTEALKVFRGLAQLPAGSLSRVSAEGLGITQNEFVWGFLLIAMVIVTDLLRHQRNMLEWLSDQKLVVRWVIYFLLMVIAMIFGVYGPGYSASDFIYVTF